MYSFSGKRLRGSDVIIESERDGVPTIGNKLVVNRNLKTEAYLCETRCRAENENKGAESKRAHALLRDDSSRT